jgi:hypothetical protein
MKILVHNDYQQLGSDTIAAKAQVALLRAHGLEVVNYWRDNCEILQYNWSKKACFLLIRYFRAKPTTKDECNGYPKEFYY